MRALIMVLVLSGCTHYIEEPVPKDVVVEHKGWIDYGVLAQS